MEFHRLSSINRETKTGICSICGPVKIVFKGSDSLTCRNKWAELRSAWYKTDKGRAYKYRHNGAKVGRYRKHLGKSCTRCGMTPENKIVLDGHHKDGNRANNSSDNIETLCACCHRLVHAGLEHLIVPYGAGRDPKLVSAVDAATTKATKAQLDKAMVGWEPVKPDETVELKAQIRALLETIGEMEDSIECLRAEIHALEELDLDEKGKLGWRKYYAIKEGKGEFDQG